MVQEKLEHLFLYIVHLNQLKKIEILFLKNNVFFTVSFLLITVELISLLFTHELFSMLFPFSLASADQRPKYFSLTTTTHHSHNVTLDDIWSAMYIAIMNQSL